MKSNFIGREEVLFKLCSILESDKSELTALIGKRRIGKTFLLKHVMKELSNKNLPLNNESNYFSFYFTGQFGLTKTESRKQINQSWLFEIKNRKELKGLLDIKDDFFGEKFNLNPSSKNFFDFFQNLKQLHFELKQKYGENGKFIVFFDEIPWIEGKNVSKNGFKNALSLFWNEYFAHENNVKFFLTGSATHWIVNHFINDKGGLHGRITNLIHLKPFTLQENYDYLKRFVNKNITKRESVLYYMAFGGVAYYLSLCSKELNFEENIKKLFSSNDIQNNIDNSQERGVLINEYDNLFRSLFTGEKQIHKKIITLLASKKNVGVTINDLMVKLKFAESEIRYAIEDLLLSNFIKERKFFNQKGKEKYYYLNDLFCYFHNSFLKKKGLNFSTQDHDFKIWCGLAFELVIFNQIHLIKEFFGFKDVETEEFTWAFKPNKQELKTGSQIDLVIERKDDKVHLLEIKFKEESNSIYGKKEDGEMRRKMENFIVENEKSLKNKKVSCLFISFEEVNFQTLSNIINAKKSLSVKDLLK